MACNSVNGNRSSCSPRWKGTTLRRRSVWWFFAAGCLLSIGTFLELGTAALGVFLTLYIVAGYVLARRNPLRDGRFLAPALVATLIGVFSIWGIYQMAFGVSLKQIVEAMYPMTRNEADGQALDATNGELIWEYERKVPEVLNAGIARFQTLAIAADLLFYSAPDGCLVALEAATGRLRWETRPGSGWYASAPLIVEGKAIVGHAGNGARSDSFIAVLKSSRMRPAQ